MSSSTKIDHKKKDILILGKSPTQGLEHTLSAEKMYSINFTGKNKTFCLSLHYNKETGQYIIWKKKTGLNGYVYKFSVDYDAIAVDDILDIQ